MDVPNACCLRSPKFAMLPKISCRTICWKLYLIVLGNFSFSRRGITKDVVELLTSAADGAKSLIDASDRLVLYVEIARLFGSLGYQRKAAFFSRQVAQLYMQQDSRLTAISAMQVLAMTTKAYRVQSRASFSNHPHSSVSALVLERMLMR